MNVALINPTADARAADEMLATLRADLAKAELALLSRMLPTYPDYVAALTTVQVMRSNIAAVEKVYGRHFKV